MAIPRSVLGHLLSGVRLYAEIPASDPCHRASIGVYPFKGTPYGRPPENHVDLPWKFRLRKFEVLSELIERGYDVHEEELERAEDLLAATENELKTFLERWPAAALTPYHSDYPI